jgi:alanyl-tRNA synthetase
LPQNRVSERTIFRQLRPEAVAYRTALSGNLVLEYPLSGGCHVTAGRLNETVRRRFDENGLPLHFSTKIVPENDPTTLFISAGMQPLKSRFQRPDGTSYGNIQYCVRTNDIDEVGDGTHLTFFQMIGSFGFGSCDYRRHVVMWTNIVRDLELPISRVNVHPDSGFERFWEGGFPVRHDSGCVWTDGNVGGFCSELFTPDGVEVGNLVNPLGHSIDVGFGYERILQVMEGKSRVDETELFHPALDPVSRDHFRALSIFKEQSIVPGNKGRNYACRRLIRKIHSVEPRRCRVPILRLDPKRERAHGAIDP